MYSFSLLKASEINTIFEKLYEKYLLPKPKTQKKSLLKDSTEKRKKFQKQEIAKTYVICGHPHFDIVR